MFLLGVWIGLTALYGFAANEAMESPIPTGWGVTISRNGIHHDPIYASRERLRSGGRCLRSVDTPGNHASTTRDTRENRYEKK